MKQKTTLILFLMVILSGCSQNQAGKQVFPWWGWLLLIIVLIIVLYFLFRQKPDGEEKTSSEQSIPIPQEVKTSEPITPDDLAIIEGIGPKIKEILKASGITKFSQLAILKPEEIKELVSAGGVHLFDPTSWPEQANLAAQGKMDELEVYQEKLKGGREV